MSEDHPRDPVTGQTARLRVRCAHQRTELKRLNRILRMKLYEQKLVHANKRLQAVDAAWQEIKASHNTLGTLISNDPWKAGWAAGLRMFLTSVAPYVPAEVAEALRVEIAWRVGDLPIINSDGTRNDNALSRVWRERRSVEKVPA